MHFDFCSAIDNARLLAAREAAWRRVAPSAAAFPPRNGRWDVLPAGGRPETRRRAAVPAANPPPTGGGSSSHAH